MRTLVSVVTAGWLNAATIHADVAEFITGPVPLVGRAVER